MAKYIYIYIYIYIYTHTHKKLEFFFQKCQKLQPVKTQNPESVFHNWWLESTLELSKWNFLGVKWFWRDPRDLGHNSYFKHMWEATPKSLCTITQKPFSSKNSWRSILKTT